MGETRGGGGENITRRWEERRKREKRMRGKRRNYDTKSLS